MKTVSALLTGLLLASLFGCEGSKLPLGPADQAPVDQRLVGTWDLVPHPDDEERAWMHILQFNDHEYYLEYVAEDDDQDMISDGKADTLRFRAYATPIDDLLFANLQCLNCDERVYFFFRYELSGEDLLLVRQFAEEVYKEPIQTLETSDALRSFVRNHRNDEALYESERIAFRRRAGGVGEDEAGGEPRP